MSNSSIDREYEQAVGRSLEDVNSSVAVPKKASFLKMLKTFSGPGALVAVGYMDPGNWITSILGGANYHYVLMSVILISSLIAMLLQYMAGKLGLVTRMDLAQMMRAHSNKPGGYILWIITELAIMATDIAEVIGSGIALHLLFGMTVLGGILLTSFDVFILLLLMKLGWRKIEAIVATLVATILFIWLYMVIKADPNWGSAIINLWPHAEIASTKAATAGVDSPLVMSLGIIGATVMPHNLFLHSSISQTRDIDRNDSQGLKEAVRFMAWDSNIQLTFAFFVNAFLLILGASLFFGHGSELAAFGDLYKALNDPSIAGVIASPMLSTLFAVALLASGQNSTITGTLTGEIVMEGFIRLKVPLWLRRVITRGLALIPVIAFAIIFGDDEGKLDQLLLYSQVFLSVALPFAMFPLLYFTGSKKIMGEYVNNKVFSILGWISAIALTLLNVYLVYTIFQAFM